MATADSSNVLADGSEVKNKVAKKKTAPKKAKSPKPIINDEGEKVTPKTGLPASEYWVAGDCQLCNSSETHCYNTSNGKHYIKCRRCGHTWAKKKRFWKKKKPS